MTNTSQKNVEKILSPVSAHMVGDGFRVHNFFPSGYRLGNHRMSPFFLLDYNAKVIFPPSQHIKGVGVHPHRGFETVTIAYHGKIAHEDSVGNKGLIGEGEVQWMTAGSGILHKEHHEESFSKSGGPFQMVQLWVNLPAKDKMTPPKYQALDRVCIAASSYIEPGTCIEVIAGNFRGIAGSAQTFSPIELYNIRLEKDFRININLPQQYNTALLMIKGEAKINRNQQAKQDQFVLFDNSGTDFELVAIENATILLLSGEPINEPIAAYGPFLMNTAEELQQAIVDFNSGAFGVLD